MSYRSRSPLAWIAYAGAGLWTRTLRVARVVVKVLAIMVIVVACVWGARLGVEHVVASPRFRLQGIEFSPTRHVAQADVLAMAGVNVGDRLLSLDTDAVAARIATHPWVEKVRVSRRLPGALVIEVTERQAVAAVALEGLYLIDESGRPFKRATMEEADGLPVFTGIARARYAQMREVSEAAFREALGIVRAYRATPGRPALGEVNIDPGLGFSLYLLEGGAEIRLGRGDYTKKLAQLDQIFEAVGATGAGGLSAIRIVHLDLPESRRVPVLLRNRAVLSARPTAPRIAKN
jgi:cell division protein FtsQ